MSSEELQKRAEELDRKFLDEGPLELREIRKQLLDKRNNAVHLITHMNSLRLQLESANVADLEDIQERLAKAVAEVEKIKKECNELEAADRDQLEQLEIEKYPEQIRPRAKALIVERRERIRALQSDVDPGHYGAVGGRIFSYIRSIDRANKENDHQTVERFTAYLNELKEEEAAMKSKLEEERNRAEVIRNEYAAKLNELL